MNNEHSRSRGPAQRAAAGVRERSGWGAERDSARSELLYLYAVVTASDADRVTGDGAPDGIDGLPVTALAEGEIAGIAGRVPAADFDEAPLNANLARMEWLAPRAEAHQRVNAHVAERATASLPLSFGSVFRSEASLRRALQSRAAELSQRLAAVRGCSEWVVTVRRDAPRAAAAAERQDPELERATADLAAATPGRRYLLERQLTELRRRAVRRSDAEAAREVGETADSAARRVHAEPLAAPTESDAPVVARLSALVERGAESQFWDALDELRERWRERGYDVERSGPWPVYRFGGSLDVGDGA